MGSFNYYYHSVIVVLVVLWLAFATAAFVPAAFDKDGGRIAFHTAAVTVASCIAAANFWIFENVNRVVQVIHLYPYSQRQITAALALIQQTETRRDVRICVKGDPDGERQKLTAEVRRLFGERWQDNGFYQSFLAISRTPIMTDAHVSHLVRTYFPFHRAQITVSPNSSSPNGAVWKC